MEQDKMGASHHWAPRRAGTISYWEGGKKINEPQNEMACPKCGKSQAEWREQGEPNDCTGV